jgi:1,4-alpha-glucan branching enzyme
MHIFEKSLEACPVLVQNNIWLKPYYAEIENRIKRFDKRTREIMSVEKTVYNFAGMHNYLGINYDEQQKGWWYREWAPEAESLHLIGDFNWWDRTSHSLKRNEYGIWEIFLADNIYKDTFKHESRYKVLVKSKAGELERIPPYTRRVVQDDKTHDFAAQVWNPAKTFSWEGDKFSTQNLDQLLIYECHVGMAQEEEKVGTFNEFTTKILPRIKAAGYTAIQMMAIQEHPYYGSFGYHVSSFFAPSSRFGTPEDLKNLIKTAHSMGIAVIMDLVHSHAVKNILEGLSYFDGTDYQYFHAGNRGNHPGWDSKLFNYGKWEVQQFLLSNIRYWLEEFHFDGFRFDGVTSMLYHHHGNTSFAKLDRYFDLDVDTAAITYLQLANTLAKKINPDCLLIAEDVSGMPGLCRPVYEGGIGFDYRLAMGIPDFWIKTLKTKRDEQWDIGDMWAALSNRPANEKVIAYAESHDQAMVGDKTIAFWLMDKEMYFGMEDGKDNLVIDRGLALHKLIRMLSISLGGDAYLNFMGNEFGHPEWIDFPREGNRWSYKYARRMWSLADNPFLKYKYFAAFDQAMVGLMKTQKLLSYKAEDVKGIHYDHPNQVLAFMKGKHLFVFCFHPSFAQFGYEVMVPYYGKYQLVFSSDSKAFGGQQRVETGTAHFTDADTGTISMYCLQRTCYVFELTDANALPVVERKPKATPEETPAIAEDTTTKEKKVSKKKKE